MRRRQRSSRIAAQCGARSCQHDVHQQHGEVVDLESYAAALRSQPLRGVMQSAAPDAGRQLREDPDQPLPQLGIELAQCVQVAVGTLAINERAEAAFHQDRPANLKRGLKPS